MSDRKRPPVVVFIIPLFIGLLGLNSVTQSPQFESYRTVHVVQLVASGACIGTALTGLMVRLLRPRAPDTKLYRSAALVAAMKARDLDGYNGLQLSAFSPDGKLLATAHDDNNARLSEIPSGNLKATLRGHVSYVVGVAFSPDGKTVATGRFDRKVSNRVTVTC